jgi:single-strand DNA-binding protein
MEDEVAVGDARIELVGRLGADPELRFTPSGAAVCDMRVVVQGRVKKGEQWEDGAATWYRVTIWRDYAENAAESFAKGDRVVVTGTLSLREFERNGGERGYSLEVNAETVTPDLRFVSVKINRIDRSGGQPRVTGGGGWDDGGQQQNRQQGGGQYGGRAQGGGGRGEPRRQTSGAAVASAARTRASPTNRRSDRLPVVARPVSATRHRQRV